MAQPLLHVGLYRRLALGCLGITAFESGLYRRFRSISQLQIKFRKFPLTIRQPSSSLLHGFTPMVCLN
jgi:hypothetical protein